MGDTTYGKPVGQYGFEFCEKVLYPVSVHFKGSGFYSTDYGRGGRKKTEPPKEGGSGDSGSTEKKSDSDSSGGEKKAAAAD